jgi:hypothetical protein
MGSARAPHAIGTPAAAALAALHARFGPPGAEPPRRAGRPPARADVLAPFQADAVARLRSTLAAHGGAILADSVGLGKTRVARALIRGTVASGGHVAVCGPAALRSHWRRHLCGLRGWTWISHTTLSRGTAPCPEPWLVVVDEAHAFRNPRTRRYDTLATLCARARVLLLTATPVNNSVMDFYHLVRLFSARHDFDDVGVTDLLTAAETAHVEPGPIRRVAAAIMVRRTRELVESSYGPHQMSADVHTAQPDGPRFPRREPVRLIRYDLAGAYPRLIAELPACLRALRFPAHKTGSARAGVAALLRLSLIKRLESSPAAFAASLAAYERLLVLFIDAARQGLRFDARRDRDLLATIDGAMQLALPRIALAPWPAHVDRDVALHDARDDLAIVRLLRNGLDDARPADPKLAALMELLDGPLRDEQVLIFTEYRDTAGLLWQALAPRGAVALVHGGGAWLGRGRASRGACRTPLRARLERCAVPARARAGAHPDRDRCARRRAQPAGRARGHQLRPAVEPRSPGPADRPHRPARLAARERARVRVPAGPQRRRAAPPAAPPEAEAARHPDRRRRRAADPGRRDHGARRGGPQ